VENKPTQNGGLEKEAFIQDSEMYEQHNRIDERFHAILPEWELSGKRASGGRDYRFAWQTTATLSLYLLWAHA